MVAAQKDEDILEALLSLYSSELGRATSLLLSNSRKIEIILLIVQTESLGSTWALTQCHRELPTALLSVRPFILSFVPSAAPTVMVLGYSRKCCNFGELVLPKLTAGSPGAQVLVIYWTLLGTKSQNFAPGQIQVSS